MSSLIAPIAPCCISAIGSDVYSSSRDLQLDEADEGDRGLLVQVGRGAKGASGEFEFTFSSCSPAHLLFEAPDQFQALTLMGE